jgi:hypothetical protein
MTIPWPGGNFPQQGWQCPCCRRVYAPFCPQCFHCGQQEAKTVPSTSPVAPGYEAPKTSGTMTVKAGSSRFEYLAGSKSIPAHDSNVLFDE